MANQTPLEWAKFERDGESEVRRKLALGLYRQERARQAHAWLEWRARKTSQQRAKRLKKTSRGRIRGKAPKHLASLRVFVSYYHGDRRLAGRVRAELQRLGISVFVAHDDINPSQEWQKTILRELERCHAFLPLLTRRFHTSKWTDQETGLAIEKRKPIVPLNVDVNPYGFAAQFQAFHLRRARIDRSSVNLFRTLRGMGRVRFLTVNSLINAFADSGDFIDSRDKSELLLECQPLSKRQINQVMRVSSRNSQIYKSTPTVKNLARLIRRHSRSIERGLLQEYQERTSWLSPRL